MAVPGLPDKPTPGPPLGKGDQAVVYEVLGEPRYVLKVYKEAVSPQDCRRIDRIIALADQKTLRGAAWPLKRYDWQGKVALLLPRIDHAEPIHTLFERQSWVTFIPDMDWRFVIAVAAQAALACARVHAAGLVVVDISDKNVLVTRAGEVTLIDCDSFVLEGAGQDGMSPVASHGWLPPELLGKTLGQIPRTANHDNFALARLIFKLLMKGSDPMGPPLGRDADSTRERVFAFSQKIPHRLPAPFELTLAALPRDVADLFEKAFAPPNAGTLIRPKAADWALALGAMTHELRQCSVAPRHFYVPLPGASCPWCVLAARNVAFDPYHGGVTARPGPVRPPAQPNVGPSPVAAFGAQQQSLWSGNLLFKAWRPVLTVGVLLTVASILYSKILPEKFSNPFSMTSPISAEKMDEKIKTFISDYFRAYESEDNPAIAVQSAHADSICYYGHMETNSSVVKKLVYNISSFKTRSYVPNLDKIDIDCAKSNSSCKVFVDVNFQVSNSTKKKDNSGLWRYIYVIDNTNDGLKIKKEGCDSANTQLSGVNQNCGLNTISCDSQ